jgi:iron complex outermembrane receptor protein
VAYAPPEYINPVPLRVQISQDIDVGLNYQTGPVNTAASYFRSNVKNEIGYDPSGCGYACNVNYDPTKREGINLSQKLALTKQLTMRANLQYVNAKFVEGAYSGKSIPGVAAFSGNLSLDYQLTAKDQVTLTSRWTQSRYMSGDFENSQSKAPGYVVEDLSYFYKEKNWSLVASIINITNKKYADTGIYKSSYTSPYNMTVYPNSGRNFSLTGRYAF